jgi:prevent-host-death family protein
MADLLLVRYTDHVARYNISDAKAKFSELVDKAIAGEEVIIARANKPLLRLVPYHGRRQALKPGSAKGQIWMAADFDEPIDDFKEYM